MPVTTDRPPDERPVLSADTAQALAHLTNPDEPYGRVVTLTGWDSPNDGYGGDFAFDPSDESTPTTKPDVVAPLGSGYRGRWKRVGRNTTAGSIQARNAATVYAENTIVFDASGLYLGDGSTAGGLVVTASGASDPTVDGAFVGATWSTFDDGTLVSIRVWTGTAWA